VVEKIVPVVDAAARAVLVLALDFVIHHHQVLLSLLFLVVFHELAEHLFSGLLPLLSDVLFDELVDTAHFLFL